MMRGITRTLGALLAASALASPAWAADITGLTPWACYEFNNSDSNSGSGGRNWNNGSISYTVGVSGNANTAASINKWTHTGNVSTTGGLTVSILATEGATHSTANNNGHLFSLAADNNTGTPQWWLRNTGTTGQLKLQGVFTEDLVITLPSGSTDTTFHHYVIAISGDRTSAAVYVDGVAVDTTNKIVKKTASGTGVNANFFGYQVGARWGGGTGSGCVVDDLRIYTATLTPGQVAALYGNLYANSTAYTRTVSAATADWSATGAWTTGDTTADLPAAGSQATLTADVDTTLTLNGAAGLSQLTLGGTGTVTVATTVATGTKGLGSATTVVNTTTDLSGVSAGLGSLTIATGKTLTVGDATITDIDTSAKGALVVKGAARYEKGDKGGVGLMNGRVITVSGSGASLSLKGNDSTGWGYAEGQKIVLQDGGTLITKSRETMITPLELCGGHLQLTAAQSSRALDFFNGTASVTDLTVAAKDGETGETLSTLTSTGSDAPAQTALIRQAPGDSNNTFSIDVADKARLRVDTILASSATYNNGNGDQTETGTAPLEKRGAGVLELTRINTYTTGTTIAGGKVLLSGEGTLGTGDVSISTGATVEIALDEGTTRTIASAITGDGAVTVTGAGTVAFSTRPTAAVTATGGSTVKYFVTYDEATAGLTASNVTVESGSSMVFELPNGATFTGTGENGNTLEPQNFYTWSPTVDSAWNTLGNWTIGGAAASTLPGTDDTVEITLTTATTLTLPEGGVTVQSVAFSGADLTLEGGALTVVAMEVPTSRTLTVQNALTISGEDGLIVNGKLSGAGTVTCSVTFASGSALVLTDDAMPLTISGSISGTIALDTTAITPSNVELTKVLSTTQSGQTFTGMPTGFETVQAGQNYYLIKTATKTLTATVSAESAAWNDLTWKNADDEEIATSLFEQVSLSATLTLGESLSSATVSYNVTNSAVPKLAGLTIGAGVVFDIASTSRLNFDVGVVTNNGEMIVRPTVSLEQIYGFPGKVEYENLTVTGQQVGGKPDELLIRDGDTVNFSGNNLPRYSAPKITMTGGTLNLASGSTAFWLGSGTTVNQSGGTVTMNPTSSSANGSANGLLLGFSGGTTYNLSGGTLDVSNNFLNYWSSSSVNVSGTGLLKVKGVFAGQTAGTLTLADNGTIELTDLQGIPAAALNTLTLDGGKIVAKQDTSIAKAATVGGAVTLSADTEKTLTVSGALSGTGSVTVDGAGVVAFTEANTYSGGTTIKNGANLTLNKENTFSDDTAASRSFSNGHNVTLETGSTLTLAAGAGFYNVTGSGKVSVSGNYYFGFGSDGGKLEADTLEVATGAHLYTRGFAQWTPADNKVIQLNTLAISGEIARDAGDDDVISLSVATKVSGTGSIGLPLTLADGATLDVTAGALTVTKPVTCSGTVAVTLPSTAAAGTTILTCSNPAEVAAKLTGAPEGLKFAATNDATAVVLTIKPTIEIPKVDDVALSAESQAVLLAKAEEAGLPSVTAVTGKTTVDGAPKTLTAAQIDAALAVFGDSIVTADGTNKTLKVSYDFGIDSMDQTESGIVITAKVQKDGTAASFANGVTVTLVDADAPDTVIATATPGTNGTATFDAIPAANLTGQQLKVKATK